MFLAHSFRLRDPWQCEARESGGLCWSRVFHRPTGLEPDDALWLVCSLLPSGAVITVNGRCMTPSDTGVSQVSDRPPCATDVPPVLPLNQFEVTTLIGDTNRIEIFLPSDLQPPASSLQPTPPFPYDVRLGIVGHS